MGPLMCSVAEELMHSKLVEWFARRGWLLGVNFVHVWRALNVCSNVDARP